MAHEAKEHDYSDDELEEILGMGGPEAKLMLKANARHHPRQSPACRSTHLRHGHTSGSECQSRPQEILTSLRLALRSYPRETRSSIGD